MAEFTPVNLTAPQSYKRDFPDVHYTFRENNLVPRVEQARALGLSYGKYMAQLHDGLIEDPMASGDEE